MLLAAPRTILKSKQAPDHHTQEDDCKTNAATVFTKRSKLLPAHSFFNIKKKGAPIGTLRNGTGGGSPFGINRGRFPIIIVSEHPVTWELCAIENKKCKQNSKCLFWTLCPKCIENTLFLIKEEEHK